MTEFRTKHFRIEEWDSSHSLATPYPRDLAETKWRPLAEMLDVVRDTISVPIKITPNGGFRSVAHNKAIGGARLSRHMLGEAADIVAIGHSAKQLQYIVLKLWREGALPRLGGVGLYRTFLHVDIRERGKNEALARWDNSTKTTQEA